MSQSRLAPADQAEVIAFLGDASSYAGVSHVDRLETHGNLVFLAGAEAWKIKRAIRFPYMDFSTLEKRRAACEREIEVNRRFAPEICIGCVPITHADGRLAFDGRGETVEWAVHMRRFNQSALLGHIATTEGISADLAKTVGDIVFKSHHEAERAHSASGAAPIAQLVSSLSKSFSLVLDGEDVARFSQQAEAQLLRVAKLLDERAGGECVRR